MTAPSTPPGSEDAGLVLSAEERALADLLSEHVMVEFGWSAETESWHCRCGEPYLLDDGAVGSSRPDRAAAWRVHVARFLAARVEAARAEERERVAAAIEGARGDSEKSDPDSPYGSTYLDGTNDGFLEGLRDAARIARTPARAAGDDTGGGDL